MAAQDESAATWKDKAPYRHRKGRGEVLGVVPLPYRPVRSALRSRIGQTVPLPRGCQKEHGAPYEWVCIFRKRDVRFVSGLDSLYFWNGELKRGWSSSSRDEEGGGGGGGDDRVLPVKVSCDICRSPIADDGRRMWLAYGPLFDFADGRVPDPFRHQCHLFYSQRYVDMDDDKPKWSGHKGQSQLIEE